MINIFRIVSFLEGISYLLLLFGAVPIKYFMDNDAFVKMLGMPHGLLFVLYIILAIVLKVMLDWRLSTFLKVCVLSILPFGTFFVGKYLDDKRMQKSTT